MNFDLFKFKFKSKFKFKLNLIRNDLKLMFQRRGRGSLCCAFKSYVSVNVDSFIMPPAFCRFVRYGA